MAETTYPGEAGHPEQGEAPPAPPPAQRGTGRKRGRPKGSGRGRASKGASPSHSPKPVQFLLLCCFFSVLFCVECFPFPQLGGPLLLMII